MHCSSGGGCHDELSGDVSGEDAFDSGGASCCGVSALKKHGCGVTAGAREVVDGARFSSPAWGLMMVRFPSSLVAAMLSRVRLKGSR